MTLRPSRTLITPIQPWAWWCGHAAAAAKPHIIQPWAWWCGHAAAAAKPLYKTSSANRETDAVLSTTAARQQNQKLQDQACNSRNAQDRITDHGMTNNNSHDQQLPFFLQRIYSMKLFVFIVSYSVSCIGFFSFSFQQQWFCCWLLIFCLPFFANYYTQWNYLFL